MDVEISNTAMNIIVTLHGHDPVHVRSTVEAIECIVRDTSCAKQVEGYPNMFAVRSGGMRVIYRTDDGRAIVTLVTADKFSE